MIHFTTALTDDLDTIRQLAQQIWNDYYTPIIGQQQVDYMLTKMYHRDSLLEQINVKQHQFYMIRKDTLPIGFFSVSSDDGVNYSLHKLYIQLQQTQGGIGTQCINWIIETLKPKSLTITVNRLNIKAINFYFKNRFTIVKAEDFDIGNGFKMNDFVMRRLA